MRGAGRTEPSARAAAAWLAFLAAISFVLFLPVLNSYWVIDDLALVHLTATIAHDHPELLVLPDIDVFWRPVAKLSMALDGIVWPYVPAGYHAVNVLLHAACAFLVSLLAWRVARRRIAAAAAGVLFAVHPVHHYAVAWISARYELLCTLFALAALLALLRRIDTGRFRWTAAFLVFQLLSLFSKELGFIVPALGLALVLAVGEGGWRQNLRDGAAPLAASFAVLAAVIVLRVVVMGGIGGPANEAGANVLGARGPLDAAWYMAIVLPWLMLAPVLGGEGVGPVRMGLFVVAAIAIAFLIAAAWWKGPHRLRRLLLLAMVPLATVPFASFIAVTKDLLGAYQFYLPSAFFTLFAAVVLFGETDRDRPRALPSIAFALLLLTGVPALVHNNLAFAKTADLSKRIHDRVLERIEPGERARLFLWDFPQIVNGVYLYVNEPHLMFLGEIDPAKIRMIPLSEGHPALYSDAPFLRDAEPETLRLLRFAWTDRQRLDFSIAGESGLLRSAVDRGGGNVYSPLEWTPSGEAYPEGTGCIVTWSGIRVDGKPVEGRLRFYDDASCERLPLGKDPRWVLTEPVEVVHVRAQGRRADRLRLVD